MFSTKTDELDKEVFFFFFSLYKAMDFTWLMCSLSTLSFNRVALLFPEE